jgi:hypothetical protein
MNLLLDTHTCLWFIARDPRLSSPAQSLIQVPGNRRMLSMASLWEIAIKVSLGKLTLAQTFDHSGVVREPRLAQGKVRECLSGEWEKTDDRIVAGQNHGDWHSAAFIDDSVPP